MHWLIILLLLPAGTAFYLLLVPQNRLHRLQHIAATGSLLTLLLSLFLAIPFDPLQKGVQLASQQQWNDRLGTYFAVGIDGLSYPLVILTALLFFLACVTSSRKLPDLRNYFMLLLWLETATLGVFIAQDWALFYVFWELVLIPLFFLIDRWGGEKRQAAALNFLM